MIDPTLAPDTRQRLLELEMRGLGVLQYRRLAQRARAAARESETPHGSVMIRYAVDSVAKALKEWLAIVAIEKRGPNFAAANILNHVNPRVAALLALRVVVDTLFTSQPLSTVSAKIGQRLQDEINFKLFRKVEPAVFARIKKKAAKASTYRHKRTITVHRANRLATPIEWRPFSINEKMRAGVKLIELIIEITGYVELYVHREFRLVRGRRRQTKHANKIRATEKLAQWINSQAARCEVLSPRYLPSYLPPRPWKSLQNGGYHYPDIIGTPALVKTKFKGHRDLLKQAAMKPIFDAVNTIQATPWRINQRVLDVARRVWEMNAAVEGLPPRDDLPLPPKPHDIDTNFEARREWKRRAFPIRDHNARSLSQRVLVERTFWIAEQFQTEKQIFFPCQLDFRGRLYALPQGLSPQGTDLAKSLLEFGQAVPLKDLDAAGWLAIHGANCYGFDKATLRERVAFIESMNDEIEAIAHDPLEHTAWMRVDAPFQFLAFCFEWAAYLQAGLSMSSRLPVAMDAACSGIQHLSAMARDEEGGHAVNLVPSATKADVYQDVCTRFLAKLQQDLTCFDTLEHSSRHVATAARLWLELQPDRTLTKPIVMTLPYGGTKYGCRSFVEDWLRTERKDKKPWPHDEDRPLVQYAADHIWQAAEEVIVGATRVMTWFKTTIGPLLNYPGPIHWTSPLGFPVFQSCPAMHKHQVQTALGDARIWLAVTTPRDDKRKPKHRNSIAPNFVHTLDATHLFMTVNLAKQNKIEHFAMVHDSFGVHAAHAGTFASCIREAFIDLYTNNDVLDDFRQTVIDQIPDGYAGPMPKPFRSGRLDFDQIRESDFFFS